MVCLFWLFQLLSMYDIIGDIHGHYDLLVKTLKSIGYTEHNNSYTHPERKIIFTGDIINRGDKIRSTVTLIKNMVENGDAYCILGNHELNAILYATLDKHGKSIRKRLLRYKMPLLKTLEEYKNYPSEFKEVIKWFRTLPLFIDMEDFRVIHGGWNDQHIKTINKYLNGENRLRKSFLKTYLINKELNTAVNELIKGKEIHLPKDLLLKDNKGILRRHFRIKWWENADDKTFKDIAFGNRFELPEYTIPKEIVPDITPYPTYAPPVFLGHYCLNKKALIFQNNICCIDTCVVRTQKLTVYRWQGEKKLTSKNLVRI
jgi:hypothetical protein